MPVGDSLPFMAGSSKTGALLTDKIEMSTAIPNIVAEKALHWGSCFAPRPCTPGCDAAGTRGCEQPVWQLLLHPKSCFFPLYVSRLMLWPEIDFAEVCWWDLLQEFLAWRRLPRAGVQDAELCAGAAQRLCAQHGKDKGLSWPWSSQGIEALHMPIQVLLLRNKAPSGFAEVADAFPMWSELLSVEQGWELTDCRLWYSFCFIIRWHGGVLMHGLLLHVLGRPVHFRHLLYRMLGRAACDPSPAHPPAAATEGAGFPTDVSEIFQALTWQILCLWVGFHCAMAWKEAWMTFNVSVLLLYKSSRSGLYFTGPIIFSS